MTDFNGRVVVVTGGANGIGEAVARRFAGHGATVAIADRDEARSVEVERQIRAAGGDAHAMPTDVRHIAEVQHLVSSVLSRWGRIDVVDNNAAALELTASDTDVLHLDPDLLMETLRGNVLSTVLVTQAVLPALIERGGGSIINMASVSGMRGDLFLSAYGLSKAAIIQLTRQVTVQYGRQGIRCNALAPSYVTTPNNEQYAPAGMKDVYLRNTPAPIMTSPEQIADVVVFLGSDEASAITGQLIPVDGAITQVLATFADFREWSATVDDLGGRPPSELAQHGADA